MHNHETDEFSCSTVYQPLTNHDSPKEYLATKTLLVGDAKSPGFWRVFWEEEELEDFRGLRIIPRTVYPYMALGRKPKLLSSIIQGQFSY